MDFFEQESAEEEKFLRRVAVSSYRTDTHFECCHSELELMMLLYSV